MTTTPGLRPALCIDLDGTVRGSKSGAKFGPHSPDDVVLLPNVAATLPRYRAAGFAVIGVSNQGVVAYGSKTVAEVEAILAATRALFEVDPFDLVLMSYAHPEGDVAPWNRPSLCRKPGIGMLGAAEILAQQAGWMIDWAQSIFVGDRPEDRECAERAGLAFMWADTFFLRAPGVFHIPDEIEWHPVRSLFLRRPAETPHVAKARASANAWVGQPTDVAWAAIDPGHPAMTEGLTGEYATPENVGGWLGWIEPPDGSWIAFVSETGHALLWTQREPDGGVVGDPVEFDRPDLAKEVTP